jgi:hypothetical protein
MDETLRSARKKSKAWNTDEHGNKRKKQKDDD